jgi:hypothetical protein
MDFLGNKELLKITGSEKMIIFIGICHRPSCLHKKNPFCVCYQRPLPPLILEGELVNDAKGQVDDGVGSSDHFLRLLLITGDGSSEHLFKGCNYKGCQGVQRKYSLTLKTDRILLWFNS